MINEIQNIAKNNIVDIFKFKYILMSNKINSKILINLILGFKWLKYNKK